LGVILYQIVTGGEFPYVVVGNIRDVLDNILNVAPEPPSRRSGKGEYGRMGTPPINATIERIVLKALAKNREERYQSAGELGREIAAYLDGQRAGEAAAPIKPVAKGSGTKIGLAVGAGLAAIAFGIWGFMRTPAPSGTAAVVAPPAAPAPAVAPAAVAVVAPSIAATTELSMPIAADPLNGELLMPAGSCHLEGDSLALTPGIKGLAVLQFGGLGWRDYDLTFEVKLNGGRGFWVETNVGPGGFCQIAVNTQVDNLAMIWHHGKEFARISPLQHLQLEPDQWYSVLVRVRGQEVHLSIDGTVRLSALGDQLLIGRAGIGTRNGAARFREIKVTSPDGMPLWSGPPDLSLLPPTALDSNKPAATEPATTMPTTMP
jgi:hypothetical protein